MLNLPSMSAGSTGWLNTFNTIITNLQTYLGRSGFLVVTYSQSVQPSMSAGDLWYNEANNKVYYCITGSTLVEFFTPQEGFLYYITSQNMWKLFDGVHVDFWAFQDRALSQFMIINAFADTATVTGYYVKTDNKLYHYDADSEIWTEFTLPSMTVPFVEFTVYCLDDSTFYKYNGSTWDVFVFSPSIDHTHTYTSDLSSYDVKAFTFVHDGVGSSTFNVGYMTADNAGDSTLGVIKFTATGSGEVVTPGLLLGVYSDAGNLSAARSIIQLNESSLSLFTYTGSRTNTLSFGSGSVVLSSNYNDLTGTFTLTEEQASIETVYGSVNITDSSVYFQCGETGARVYATSTGAGIMAYPYTGVPKYFFTITPLTFILSVSNDDTVYGSGSIFYSKALNTLTLGVSTTTTNTLDTGCTLTIGTDSVKINGVSGLFGESVVWFYTPKLGIGVSSAQTAPFHVAVVTKFANTSTVTFDGPATFNGANTFNGGTTFVGSARFVDGAYLYFTTTYNVRISSSDSDKILYFYASRFRYSPLAQTTSIDIMEFMNAVNYNITYSDYNTGSPNPMLRFWCKNTGGGSMFEFRLNRSYTQKPLIVGYQDVSSPSNQLICYGSTYLRQHSSDTTSSSVLEVVRTTSSTKNALTITSGTSTAYAIVVKPPLTTDSDISNFISLTSGYQGSGVATYNLLSFVVDLLQNSHTFTVYYQNNDTERAIVYDINSSTGMSTTADAIHIFKCTAASGGYAGMVLRMSTFDAFKVWKPEGSPNYNAANTYGEFTGDTFNFSSSSVVVSSAGYFKGKFRASNNSNGLSGTIAYYDVGYGENRYATFTDGILTATGTHGTGA